MSILIVNYNGGEILNACLKSLNKTKYPNYELVVVDNGSTDESVNITRENHKKVKLVEAKKNLGFAIGNRVALNSARGEYLLLLNGDTEVEPDWLTELVAFAEEHKEAGVFGPKILFFEDKKIINSAGGLCDIFGYSPLRGTFDKNCAEFNIPKTVFYAHGAAMMIRKSLIDKIGFLDETFFIYYEEMDFCWRTWLSGSKVYYIPNSIVYHKVKKRYFYQKEKLAQRQFLVKKNRIRTIIKNHKSLYLIFISLMVNLIVSFAELFVLIIKGDFESPKGIIRAFWWNLQVLNNTLEEKRKVQRLYKVSEKYVLSHMRKIPFAIDIAIGIVKGKYSLPL